MIVVVGTPAATRIDEPLDTTESALLTTSYKYSSTAVGAFGVSESWPIPPELTNVYGILIPRRERDRIAAIAVETAKSPDRAATGTLLNVMVDGTAGSEMAHWSEQQVVSTRLTELEHLLPGISAHLTPIATHFWPHAEPKSPVRRSRHIAAYGARSNSTRRVTLAGAYLGMPFTEEAAETGRWAASQVNSK